MRFLLVWAYVGRLLKIHSSLLKVRFDSQNEMILSNTVSKKRGSQFPTVVLNAQSFLYELRKSTHSFLLPIQRLFDYRNRGSISVSEFVILVVVTAQFSSVAPKNLFFTRQIIQSSSNTVFVLVN